MKRLILTGFDAGTAEWLQTRLRGLSATSLAWGTLPGECDLLVLKDPGNGAQSLAFLETRSDAAPVVCWCAKESEAAIAERLDACLGVQRVLRGPVDRDELARQVASALGLRPPAEDVSTAAARAMAALWQRFQGTIRDRVQLVDDAADALGQGALSDDLRQKAGEAAHKLAGSLGTFGFHRGTALAVQLEGILLSGTSLEQADAAGLGKMVAEMRKELDHPPGA